MSEEVNKKVNEHAEVKKSTVAMVKLENVSAEDVKDREVFKTKYAVTGDKLLDAKVENIPSLVEPIIPKTGLVGVIGGSDTGKSSLLRQWAVSIVLGHDTLWGFKLNSKFNSCLYVSSEDDETAISYLLNKQKSKNDESIRYQKLRYIFNLEDLANKLDRELTLYPCDATFIDAFGDIFQGNMNDTSQVRGCLNKFNALAQKHKTLFVFLQHTGKGKEAYTPSKNNSLGSQGFEAKMRLVIELKKDKHDPQLRHMCIVKGNYLPEHFKNQSFVMKFEENMTFTYTGTRVPFSQLGSNNNGHQEPDWAPLAQKLKAEGMSSRAISTELDKSGFKVGKTKVAETLKAAEKQEDCPSGETTSKSADADSQNELNGNGGDEEKAE